MKFPKYIINGVVIVATVASVVACDTRKKEKTIVSINGEMSSEELVDSGEQLMSGSSFMLADRIFKLALKVDPANPRAQFYHNLLKPLVAYKGLATRIKPWIRQHGNKGNDPLTIEEYEQNIAKAPASHVKSFLVDGREDIRTVTDVQNWIQEMKLAWSDLRKFLKGRAKANGHLALNLNVEAFRDYLEQKSKDHCYQVQPKKAGETIRIECDQSNLLIEKLNYADFTALQQIAAGMELLYAFYNSYSLEGIEKLDESFEKLTPPQKQTKLESIATLGHLRQNNMFAVLREIGSDLIAAQEIALNAQKELCHFGEQNKYNRDGYLFKMGFCVPAEEIEDTKNSIEFARKALAGPVEVDEEITDDKGVVTGSIKTTINLSAILDNPIKDLRSIAPKSYDPTCFAITDMRDHTFGGYYPNGDGMKFVDTKCPKLSTGTNQ